MEHVFNCGEFWAIFGNSAVYLNEWVFPKILFNNYFGIESSPGTRTRDLSNREQRHFNHCATGSSKK